MATKISSSYEPYIISSKAEADSVNIPYLGRSYVQSDSEQIIRWINGALDSNTRLRDEYAVKNNRILIEKLIEQWKMLNPGVELPVEGKGVIGYIKHCLGGICTSRKQTAPAAKSGNSGNFTAAALRSNRPGSSAAPPTYGVPAARRLDAGWYGGIGSSVYGSAPEPSTPRTDVAMTSEDKRNSFRDYFNTYWTGSQHEYGLYVPVNKGTAIELPLTGYIGKGKTQDEIEKAYYRMKGWELYYGGARKRRHSRRHKSRSRKSQKTQSRKNRKQSRSRR